MSSRVVPLTQTGYTSHPTIAFSDHRPVTADFVLSTRLCNSRVLLDPLMRGLNAQVARIDVLALDAATNALSEAVADVDPENLHALPALSVGNTISSGAPLPVPARTRHSRPWP
jgi:phosphatidylinositol-bisphosphatase